jgi:hypothetical protein
MRSFDPATTVVIMLAFRGRAMGSSAVVVSLAAGTLVFSFGAAFHVTRALLTDGTTFLAKGDTVAHASAAAGRIDAEVATPLTTEPGGVRPIEPGNGQVYTVNTVGEMNRIDQTTMTPAATRNAVGDPAAVDIAAAGTDTYLVAGTGVDQINPLDMQTLDHVPVEGAVDAHVVDNDNRLLVANNARGDVTPIVNGKVAEPLQVAAPNHHLQLGTTTAGPFVIDLDTGTIALIQNGTVGPSVALGLAKGSAVELADPATPSQWAWLLLKGTGELMRVDFDKRTTQSLALRADGDYGRPVFFQGRCCPTRRMRMVATRWVGM